MTELAQSLRKYREEKNKSQYQLSKELNIKRSAYGNYETGMSFPEYKVLEKIANYYDVEVKVLLGLSARFENDLNVEKESEELQRFIKEYYYKKYRKIPSNNSLKSILKKIEQKENYGK